MWYFKGLVILIIGIVWLFNYGEKYESEVDKWKKREYLLFMNYGMIATLIGIVVMICGAGL